MDGSGSGSNILSSLGVVHIWISLIFLPLAFIGVICLMIFDSQWQRGWNQGTATCLETTSNCPLTESSLPYRCPVKVTIDSLGDKIYSMTYVTKKQVVNQGDSWRVAYDPSNPEGTLTQYVSTSTSRTTTLTILGALLVIIIFLFALNVVFRKNKTFKEVSGVMEIGSLANGLGGGFLR